MTPNPKKWQTTVYVPAEYKEVVKSNKLDLSSIILEQLLYITGSDTKTGVRMCPTVDKTRAMEVIKSTIPGFIAENYDPNWLFRWLPENDVHGDYMDRLASYVNNAQKYTGLDGYSSEILIYTRDYLASADIPA
jgi:hypothetical protein